MVGMVGDFKRAFCAESFCEKNKKKGSEDDFLEAFVRVVRCRDCRHNNNCEIQHSAQAAGGFYCGAGERK